MSFGGWLICPGLPLAAFAVAVIWVVVVAVRSAIKNPTPRARRKEMADLAGELGFSFADGPEELVPPDCLDCIDRTGRHVLQGRLAGREAFIFDALTGNSAVMVRVEGTLPHLTVRPENAFTKADGALNRLEDMGLESREFSRSCVVNCADRRFASAVLTPRAMELLLADRGWCLEIHRDVVLLCRNRLMTTEELRGALETLSRFIESVPGYVWKDHAPQEAAPNAHP